MGYELIYKYRKKDEDGSWGEEIHDKKQKVGSPYEDVGLEAAAGKIIAQLANRSILVEDVEIYEFTKKKLSFKQTDDGILIKNKKFSFDDGPASAKSDDEATQQLLELLQSNPGLLQKIGMQGAPATTVVAAGNGRVLPSDRPLATPKDPVNVATPLVTDDGQVKRPKRMETFEPARPGQEKQFPFLTPGKKYAVFDEITRGIPPVSTTEYLIVDDQGRERRMPAEHFMPPTAGRLSFENEMMDDPRGAAPEVKLSYGGGNDWNNVPMPSLR